jgi:hypothetical protein
MNVITSFLFSLEMVHNIQSSKEIKDYTSTANLFLFWRYNNYHYYLPLASV